MAELFLVPPQQAPSPASAHFSDPEAREAALDVERSWIVEAPAGSGKTGLLIQRYLKLLARDGVDRPEQVLAITFTEKATAEMRERVMTHLDEAAKKTAIVHAFDIITRQFADEVLRKDAALGWGLLESPSRLNIRTIHSVCAEIARSLPVSSGSGGRLSPLKEADVLYRNAARRTLMELGGPDTQLDAAIRKVMLHRDGNLGDCERLIAGMLKVRDQWGDLVRLGTTELTDAFLDQDIRPRLERALELTICAGLTRLDRTMSPDFLRELSEMAGRMGHLPGYKNDTNPLNICAGLQQAPETTAEYLDHWRALLHLLVKKDGKVRARATPFDVQLMIEKRDAARLRELHESIKNDHQLLEVIAEVRSLPPPTFPLDQWDVTKALFRLLRRALVELQLRFAETGECDFAELELAAKAALRFGGGLRDLTEAAGMRLEHLLVDEMQDTSAGQYEIIELLTHGWDGQSQTVFLVGDPKQSIYLFRQARVERFLETMRTGRLGELPIGSLRLTANFRSQSALVNGFNADFSLLFPSSTDTRQTGEVTYTQAEAARPPTLGEGRQWHTATVPYEKDSILQAQRRLDAYRNEAQQIRSIVQQWRKRRLPADRTRPWRIAVLVRGRAHLTEIVAALKDDRQGKPIPFRAVEIEPLKERQIVLDLLALTRALLHPADRVAWLALLRSPWCGLGLAELHLLAGADDSNFAERSIPDVIAERGHLLNDDACARLARLWPVLKAALDQRDRLTPSELVERTWRSLGGAACATAAELRDARRYLDLLDELQSQTDAQGGGIDLRTLTSELNRLHAEPEASPDAIDLMTIHGAKGLEWDVVIIPGLERKVVSTYAALLNWVEVDIPDTDAAHFLLAPIAAKGGASQELHSWINGVLKRREAAERKRLFYVACTRAREALYLFASPVLSSNGEVRPEGTSLLKAAWPAVESRFTAATSVRRQLTLGLSIAAAEEPKAHPTPKLQRLPLSFDPATQFTGGIVWQQPPELLSETTGDFIRPEGSLSARALGNAVHSLLELAARRLMRQADLPSLHAELPTWTPRIAAMLRAEGLAPDIVRRLTPEVKLALENTLNDPHGQWLLQAAEGSQTEFALTRWHQQRTGLRLDRVFAAGHEPLVSGNDFLWIVDYKTTRHGNAGIVDFLEQQRETYAAQMETYARAARTLSGGRQIRVGLYYPLLPKLLWWIPKEP